MLIIALMFPVALLVVAMLLARLENWVDGESLRTRRFVSPAMDDAGPFPRGEPWAHGVREGATR
jgi:hypothetical protein